MVELTAAEIVKRCFDDSVNFMTPDILEYGKITSTVAYELSRGNVFGHFGYKNLYGVTIVELLHDDKVRHRNDLCKCFYKLEDAKNYISKLSKGGYFHV